MAASVTVWGTFFMAARGGQTGIVIPQNDARCRCPAVRANRVIPVFDTVDATISASYTPPYVHWYDQSEQ
ncbi:hypothetical protein Bpla01_51140 [Burkholderia plantarii]|nr:hypothetical protein Bpla01_51140 [Burkholderia plantarii]